MNTRLVRALSALAVSGAAFSFATGAQATTVQFASTLTFSNPVSKVDLSSTGLNAILTVGVPDVISQFITVTVGTGTWSATNSPVTANFNFTIPTPGGPTTDSGAITGGQVNGGGAHGSLSISWPNQPVEFDFADGTKLDVTLGNLVTSCTSGNNCIAGTYFMTGTFLVLNGPTGGGTANGETPIPAALPLFASGLGALGFFGLRNRKRKLAA
jgi:hypothetical protein